MSATVDKLAEVALGLPEQERAELAHKILVSLDGELEEGVEEAWEAEIGRRIEEIRSGAVQGIPAEEVFRDVRAGNL